MNIAEDRKHCFPGRLSCMLGGLQTVFCCEAMNHNNLKTTLPQVLIAALIKVYRDFRQELSKIGCCRWSRKKRSYRWLDWCQLVLPMIGWLRTYNIKENIIVGFCTFGSRTLPLKPVYERKKASTCRPTKEDISSDKLHQPDGLSPSRHRRTNIS